MAAYEASGENFPVMCPFCGEEIDVWLEADVTGTLVQDCEVCCNPWLVQISGKGEERWVEVRRGDGSE